MKPQRLNVWVEAAVRGRDRVGESPVWCEREQALYWVDILAPSIHRWSPSKGARRTWPMPAAVGSIGLCESGRVVAALRSGFAFVDLDDGHVTPIVHPEPHRRGNRLNDGKVAPDGSFWAGTMDDRPEKQAMGSLYRLAPDGRCTRMSGGFIVSNGLAWSPDGRTLYHSDSRAATVWRYAHEPGTGRLGPRAVHITMRPEWGRPDGAAVDAEGCYWNCGIGAGRINRFSPKGDLVQWVDLPVSHPTMPCFGGPGLRTLYVTTLRDGLDGAALLSAPLAGSVLCLDAGIAGAPLARYADGEPAVPPPADAQRAGQA